MVWQSSITAPLPSLPRCSTVILVPPVMLCSGPALQLLCGRSLIRSETQVTRAQREPEGSHGLTAHRGHVMQAWRTHWGSSILDPSHAKREKTHLSINWRGWKNKARIEKICLLICFLIKQPFFEGTKTCIITSQWRSLLLKRITNWGGCASCKSTQRPPCRWLSGMMEGAIPHLPGPAALSEWHSWPDGVLQAWYLHKAESYPPTGIVSATCSRDTLLMTSFISQTHFFYELQRHALLLWGAVKLMASII